MNRFALLAGLLATTTAIAFAAPPLGSEALHRTTNALGLLLVGTVAVFMYMYPEISFRLLGMRQPSTQRKDHFHEVTRGRKPLNSAKFAEKFFRTEQRELAMRVRETLEKAYPRDARLLEADDEPYQPPLFIDDVSLYPAEFLNGLQNEFQIKILDDETTELRTIRDFVNFVARKTGK